ncbi:MAG: response regulator [Pseudodonghicola sp.]|nr:response regulator [Pseudodonghicola sp.]
MSEDGSIHIVDDDRAAREGLGFLLSSLGLEIRQHGSALDLLGTLGDQAEGCILADVRMPGMTGLELLDELKARNCPLPVIMITGHGDVPMAVRAMRSGAIDFFEKPVDGMALVDRIKEALSESRQQADAARTAAALRERTQSLTTRETEIARAVLSGRQNKQIADALGISLKTVEIHRHNAMDKMGARSAADLVRLLVAAGWADS